jgi:ABC-type sugar transport system ATPase subunit
MSESDMLLELRRVRKAYQGVRALDDVNLDIRRGETHFLLGENGAGKSTLVKILAGVFPPDAGAFYFHGMRPFFSDPGEAQKAGVRVLHQETQLVRQLTVADNIFLGDEPKRRSMIPLLDRGSMAAGAQSLLDRLNLPLDPEAVVAELNAAEQRMVEIARALHHSAELIILDEPTAALSVRETGDLFSVLRSLRAQGVTMLYISHRLEEVLPLGDRATVLRDGRKVATIGLADASLGDLIRLITGRSPESAPPRPEASLGGELLRVEKLRCPGLHGEISFSLRAGEVVGLTGLQGAGGTALSRALFGIDPAEGGEIYMDGRPVRIRTPESAIALGIGLLPEDRMEQGLILEMRVRHNMTLAALENAWPGPFIDHSHERSIIGYYARQLGIREESLNRPARTLSGGTQQTGAGRQPF